MEREFSSLWCKLTTRDDVQLKKLDSLAVVVLLGTSTLFSGLCKRFAKTVLTELNLYLVNCLENHTPECVILRRMVCEWAQEPKDQPSYWALTSEIAIFEEGRN
jgi:hypothetical protein